MWGKWGTEQDPQGQCSRFSESSMENPELGQISVSENLYRSQGSFTSSGQRFQVAVPAARGLCERWTGDNRDPGLWVLSSAPPQEACTSQGSQWTLPLFSPLLPFLPALCLRLSRSLCLFKLLLFLLFLLVKVKSRGRLGGVPWVFQWPIGEADF